MPKSLIKTTSKEKRVIFVGAKRSGKTTALGLLSLACDLLSQEDKAFSHYIDEKTSGICQVPSDLCQGLFPEETPSGFVYEAQMHIREKRPFRERNVTVPVCETAGEDMELLTGPYQDSIYHQKPDWQSSDILNKYICDSHGYIMALPVSAANIPWVPDEFKDSIDEPVDEQGRYVDPDLVLKRILSAIFRYKSRNRTSPPVEGLAVLLTKSDKIMHFSKGHGMDLNTPDGQQKFLNMYFRQTMSVLKFYGLEKVKFFPFFVEVEKIRGPDNKIIIHKNNMGKPQIVIDHENNLPVFSKTTAGEAIHWILETFG